MNHQTQEVEIDVKGGLCGEAGVADDPHGSESPSVAKKHSVWGITFIILGALSASIMFLLVKLLADTNTFTLVFYRALVQILFSLVALLREGTHPLGSRPVRHLLVLRAAFGAIAVCAWFFGAQILPLPDAVTLQFTTPPFAAAFALCLVGEPWMPLDMVGAVVCFVGVALILHPTWMFGGPAQENGEDVSGIIMQVLAVLITTAGSAVAGLAYVSVRLIGDKASALVMVFYYGVISIPVSLIGSVLFEGTWNVVCGGRDTPFSARDYVLIFLIGLLGHAGQWFLNIGLQLETAATATLATCTQIVWTYIFELAFLHEAINRWSLVGTGIILGYMLVVTAIKMGISNESDTPPKHSDEEASELTTLLDSKNS